MKGLVLLFIVFSWFSGFSQAVINFSTRAHDFGNVKEVNGTVSYNFEFTNSGKAPIIVKNVESSCGCTSPEWTKQPILPGKTGFVKATFDPKDRPGHFDKTITVFSNTTTPVVELKIAGTVEGRTRTVLDDYPYELPSGLRLPLDHISLMKTGKGEVKTMAIGIYNNSGRKVSVSFADIPAHLKISINPQQIEAKQTASVTASYNTAQDGEYGLNKEIVTLIVDGKKYQLPVSVYVEEDFSKVNQGNAPALEAAKKYYNFGTAKEAVFVYTLKNTGKAPMKIHRVYTNDKRITAETAKNELQPGETTLVTAKIVKGAEIGKVSCVISVINNSPLTPDLGLRFYGEIK